MRIFSIENIIPNMIAILMAVVVGYFYNSWLGFGVGLAIWGTTIYSGVAGYTRGRTEANGRPVIDVTVLANIVLTAMRLRENSYDREAAEAIDPGLLSTNYNNYYTLTYDEAADRAIEQHGGDPLLTTFVATAIRHSWNQCEEWAAPLASSAAR